MPTKFPPALDLSNAVRAAKDIHGIHGDDRFNIDLLVDVLDTTKTSSNFPRRISALQTFGLLEKVNDTAQLTPLAIQIANPVAGEDGEAKILAFKKVDVLDELLRRYPNAKLPNDQNQLKQVLLKSLNINKDSVEDWHEFVVNSFRAISGIPSETKVTAPILTQIPQPAFGDIGAVVHKAINYQNFVLPNGGKFEFSLPENPTSEDLDFIIGFFELKKKSLTK